MKFNNYEELFEHMYGGFPVDLTPYNSASEMTRDEILTVAADKIKNEEEIFEMNWFEEGSDDFLKIFRCYLLSKGTSNENLCRHELIKLLENMAKDYYFDQIQDDLDDMNVRKAISENIHYENKDAIDFCQSKFL